MFNSDRKKGQAILIVTAILFSYYTISVIGLPFIENDRVRAFFAHHGIALMVPAISGLCFIGGLVLFTIYHVKPYFSYKPNKRHEPQSVNQKQA
ncbi:dolichol-phosphate mannose synthase subunit 2 [Ceratina calcarata]|uniref:Dolichol phosphate-mannose biosynthesis regulatory protein n=1 Tax=Ceratina calcarata TaxID=156304 RepID=A0AAJ7IRD1_9HYME|nr:dolichol-phosphate mannose synthase subunit 2 [Ceratina calcarata]